MRTTRKPGLYNTDWGVSEVEVEVGFAQKRTNHQKNTGKRHTKAKSRGPKNLFPKAVATLFRGVSEASRHKAGFFPGLRSKRTIQSSTIGLQRGLCLDCLEELNDHDG